MKRRNLIIGMGSFAAAGGAAVGTGAFSTAEATRDVSVRVANENNAYLSIKPSNTANGQFATQGSSNQIGLDFSGSGNSGSGVGQDSVYNFDDVFRISNQGTQTIYVWSRLSGGSKFDDNNLYFYPNDSRATELNDSSNSVLTLSPGEGAKVGVHVDTESVSTGSDTITATIRADVNKPENSGSVGPDGDQALVVSQDGDTGDFSSIQSAIDSADGTDIIVQPGTYEERPVIPGSASGLTLRGAGEGEVTIDASDDSQFSNRYGLEIEAGAEDVTLRDFTLKGPVSTGGGYPSGYFGLKIYGVTGLEVRNVTVKGSSLSEVDLNGVTDAVLANVTADGENPNASSTSGTGLFLTNCRNITVKNIKTRNNDWGGIGISAWDQGGDDGEAGQEVGADPAARGISLVGTNNEIEEDLPLYTEEEPGGTDFHQQNRNSEVDTDGDSDWDVFFPIAGDSSAGSDHDVTVGTVDPGSGVSNSLSHTVTLKRYPVVVTDDEDAPNEVGSAGLITEQYFVSSSERESVINSPRVADSWNAGGDLNEVEFSGGFVYQIERKDNV
ncbi:DUF1102 domain-containing protein [Halorubrum sp. SP9]|uniref:DUF1102 domain-containing protein n=2 Tax=unclassified Halorubrum TaxID=2642239 RepID=UPI0013051E4C|nr:DUF1102 domain-containing protein [Halorubrum sp. SP9]